MPLFLGWKSPPHKRLGLFWRSSVGVHIRARLEAWRKRPADGGPCRCAAVASHHERRVDAERCRGWIEQEVLVAMRAQFKTRMASNAEFTNQRHWLSSM